MIAVLGFLGRIQGPEQISFNRFDFVDCGKDGTIIWNPDLKMYLSEDNYPLEASSQYTGLRLLKRRKNLAAQVPREVKSQYTGSELGPPRDC